MEIWLLILASLSVTLLLHLLLRCRNSSSLQLPPDPHFIPFITALDLSRQVGGITSYLRSVHNRLGPIVTLRVTSRPDIFVIDRSLTHEALILNGAVFASRPPPPPIIKIFSSNRHNISSASYGATWRILRRNLMSEILHPSRLRTYSHARRWISEVLLDRIRNYGGEKPIVIIDYLREAMFALLVFMCFGVMLDEKQIKELEFVLRQQLLSPLKFKNLNRWPKLTKLIFRERWEELLQIRREQVGSLIRARKKKSTEDEEDYVKAYVDTLFDLELPDEKRKLNETEIVSICSEFINAGADSTATSLQWIMANLVKNQEIQEKLYEEVKSMVGEEAEEVGDEDVQKMPYLKAVVLEGLRRHPPGDFLLPHSVTEDTVLGGYKIPKKGSVNFVIGDIGRDPKICEEPMAFKPERFLGEVEEANVDITGSKEIKMIPFGAGRRICPGMGLAMLHLKYYVANLVKEFHWKEVEGDEVDLTETYKFTVVMKHSLGPSTLLETRLEVLMNKIIVNEEGKIIFKKLLNLIPK